MAAFRALRSARARESHGSGGQPEAGRPAPYGPVIPEEARAPVRTRPRSRRSLSAFQNSILNTPNLHRRVNGRSVSKSFRFRSCLRKLRYYYVASSPPAWILVGQHSHLMFVYAQVNSDGTITAVAGTVSGPGGQKHPRGAPPGGTWEEESSCCGMKKQKASKAHKAHQSLLSLATGVH